MANMKRFRGRSLLAVLVLVATVVIFVHYFATHPSVGQQLQHTPVSILLLLLGLYLLGIGALAAITWSTLRLCNVQLGNLESLLLTAYTAIINFFGPLQSGPAFRGVYLKAKHGLKLRNYAAATLVYYFFYGLCSSLMLVSGILKWWLVALLVITIALVATTKDSPFVRRRLSGINLRASYYLALATLAQVMIVACIYYVELRTVAPGTSIGQAIIYAGAANLALFVSITPAAIGFRESFLVFSERLHHVSSSTIVAASILDRSLYIAMLLILALFVFGTHAQQRLQPKKSTDA